MADSSDSDELHWYDPPIRTLMPLDERFHVSRRLERTIKARPYRVSADEDFEAVITSCAAPSHGREKTWINGKIVRLYTDLHRQGHAHSVEVWENKSLVGGLYGVSLGRAFFGESMFSRKTDASKIALVHLVNTLRSCGYEILDCQFMTPHLARFGAFEINRSEYLSMLQTSIDKPAPMFDACTA